MRSVPFKEETMRVELLTRLNQIDRMKLSADVITLRPNVEMSSLSEGTRLKDFLAVMDCVVHELKQKN
jgi:hypothetical protein